MKTNAARILDSLGVAYELRSYEVDLEDLSATSVAAKVGLPPEQVFKTLVARGDAHLDLKALARATGDRRVELVPLRDVLPLTGYVRGGVTALACKKSYPVFLDETAALFDQISVSAGARGLQLVLAPADYLRVTHATLCPLT